MIKQALLSIIFIIVLLISIPLIIFFCETIGIPVLIFLPLVFITIMITLFPEIDNYQDI